MKITQNTHNIERFGVEDSNSFTIKSTAKSFEILSSGLYTDPITAIIRELSCNAYDSHVEAGKVDIPFRIHLPNSLEPFLSIRDFGTGLSDEDVLHLYTTYFDSTKTNSNDYIGALGLGSKSPFSYTKSYEVISRYNGYFRSYHMFINEHGIPDVVKMATQPTTEENGLEVKIGVDPSDFRLFTNKTASCLKHFTVKPDIVGALHFAFDPLPTNKIESERWCAFDSSGSYYPSKFTAVQGNVQYRVNIGQLSEELTDDDRSLFGQLSVVGYFDIGELEVAANREEIRYDPKTKQALSKFVKTMMRELSKKVVAQCKTYDTYWEACLELSKVSGDLFGDRYAMRNVIRASDVNHPILERYLENNGDVHLPSVLHCHSVYTYTVNTGYSSSQYSRDKTSDAFEPSAGIIILRSDVKSGGVGRLVEYAQNERGVRRVIVIKEHPHVFSDEQKAAIPNHADYPECEYLDIIKELGDPVVSSLKDLCPPLPKAKTVRTLKAFSYRRTTWVGYNKRVVWDKYDVNVNRGGIYFVLKQGSQMVASYDNNERNVHWEPERTHAYLQHLTNFVNADRGTSYKMSDVVGVSVATWKKIKDESQWVDGFDALTRGMPKISDNITTIQRTNETLGQYGIMKCIQQAPIREVIKTLPASSPFVVATADAVAAWDKISDRSSYYNFCADMYQSLIGRVDVEPYFGYNDYTQYPLFGVLETLPTTVDEFEAVVEYITLMDEKNKS